MGFSEPRGLLLRRESVGRQDRTVVRAAEALVRRGRGVVLRRVRQVRWQSLLGKGWFLKF